MHLSTLYELFKLNEDASQEEIKESYEKILEEANNLPQNEQTVNQVRRIKIAYGILSDPQKRKDYDLNLAEKRANELIKKIEIKPPTIEKKENDFQGNIKNEEVIYNHNNTEMRKKSQIRQIKEKIDRNQNTKQSKNVKKSNVSKNEDRSQISNKTMSNDKDFNNSKREEEKKIREQKRKYKKEKRAEKKEKQRKREMEIQAYGKYLKEQGYKVKYPWTWPRIKRLLIAIFVIVICSIIVCHIPFVNRTLNNLYNDNIFVQKIVDIFVSIVKALFDTIKGIFIIS